MTDLIVNLILLVCGFVMGYNARRTPAKEIVERLKVERVSVPQLVEKIVERVRVEYVDKPIVVEKPTVQIERVEVPYVVEKTIVEKAAPVASRGLEPPADRETPPPANAITVVMMDAHERTVKLTEVMATSARRPTLLRTGMKFVAARRAENGDWIYRQLPRERA